jgi:geranylgeranyl diphosphate synthase type II
MLINALQKAQGADKQELERWIAATDFSRDEKVKAVTALYNKLGIDLMAKAKMEDYYQQALQAMAKVNLPDSKKSTLLAYAAKMMKREK